MRILYVHDKCGYFGGAEQNVVDSARGLRRRGHECLLAFGTSTARGAGEFGESFQETLRCHEVGAGTGDPSGLGFQEVLKRAAPDAIYFHKVDDLSFFQSHIGSVRAVRMVHDHDLCCPRRHKYFAFSRRICRRRAGWRCWTDLAFLARDRSSPVGLRFVNVFGKLREMQRNTRLDRLLVGSGFMREVLIQNGFPPGKVHVLAPVVPRSGPPPEKVPDDPHIVFIGHVSRGKGVDYLLHALRKISSPFRATIVGFGHLQAEARRLSRDLGLEERVHFQGWVSHEEVGRFYSSAKVVVVPSRVAEPFGMVGLEAMWHGRGVVAFDVGGISDWLQDGVTGLLAPERDTTALAAALERVVSDTELAQQLGSQGYERVRSLYSFDEYLDRLEKHLEGT